MTRTVITYGLAPSSMLAPSLTLPPADNVYGGGPITPHRILMSLNADNTLVDVSPWVEFGQGVTYSYGRQTEFDDTGPGTFTFTLNNADGRFTPDNPNSPFGRTVMEGTTVTWVLGTRLVTTHVLSVEIPSNEEQWDQLVVTCDDALGRAGRHSFTSIPDGLLAQLGPKVLWKLDEGPEAQFGVESFGDPLGPFALSRSNPTSTTEAVTFGTTQPAGLPGTAVTLTAAPGETNFFGTKRGNTVLNTRITSPYLAPATTNVSIPIGFYNMWVLPGSRINLAVVPQFGAENPGYAWPAQIRVTPTTVAVVPGSAPGFTYQMTAAEQLVPHYYSMRFAMVWQTAGNYWALFCNLYVDGSMKGSAGWYDPQHGYRVPAYLNSLAPLEVAVFVEAKGSQTVTGTVQRISYTTNTTYWALERLALIPTLAGRVNAADFVGEDVNMRIVGTLSTAPIGFSDTGPGTLLDLLNEVARTETGYLYSQTIGTTASSLAYVNIRARDRPATPAASFHVSDELDGLPSFVRDITNVAAQVDVSGPTQTVTVSDSSITGRYITAGLSETVLFSQTDDLRVWGQDRLNRAKNRSVRVQQFTVDTTTTPTDRSADLLALVPGDRVRLTGTPQARLGFTTWDGFVLGGSETHTFDGNRFTFTLTPTGTPIATYNTSRYAAAGDVTLGSSMTAAQTTVVFNTFTPVSSTAPYTIQVDKEQMTVTAVTGSTWTLTRGVNGTSPVSHTVGTSVEVIPTALYAY